MSKSESKLETKRSENRLKKENIIFKSNRND